MTLIKTIIFSIFSIFRLTDIKTLKLLYYNNLSYTVLTILRKYLFYFSDVIHVLTSP